MTCWTTASESVNSVINLKLALKKMVSNHDKILINNKIKLIIQLKFFFKFMSSWICSGFSKKKQYFH
jgi:hypothetical protein